MKLSCLDDAALNLQVKDTKKHFYRWNELQIDRVFPTNIFL